ncbi:hypothetical protein GCM10010320_71810 [Streptomyces caelestis]|uniref:Uncharacterized protein n=1 Tax=Streptomyces caelestis TaxID=36816 RepID=A0A7W9LQ60_9ACTN|nr:hypothetical protein [Streptomyces caelestis]GGW79452.1 hypothetical protein GCM10010320_71810 [Streptomyces caelestis]
MTGPTAKPAAKAAAKMPMAWARRRESGNSSLSTASAEGSRVAPATPMSARQAMRSSGAGANAAPAEPSPNTVAPIINSFSRP